MRISEQQRFVVSNRNVDVAKDQHMNDLKVLSSQRQLNALHDDPVGAARVVKHKSAHADYESFSKNVDFSRGFVDTTETSIASIAERLGRAHELALAMSNDTYGPDSHRATAKEVDEIRKQIIQLGNARYNGRHVFSGFRSLSPAVDRDGTFLGDDGAIFLQVGHGHFKQINIQGRDLFEADGDERQAGHMNMIDTLEGLKEALESSDKETIYRMVDELNFQMGKTNSYQASVGAIWQTLEKVGASLEVAVEGEVKSVSNIEDADIFKSTSKFRKSEAILQSTLLASSKFLQPSLLNFLQ